MRMRTVNRAKQTTCALLLLLFVPLVSYSMTTVHAPICCPTGTYSLTPLPGSIQEGNSVDLLLSVSGAQPGIQYEFIFHVLDPSSTDWKSPNQDITPTGSSFTV